MNVRTHDTRLTTARIIGVALLFILSIPSLGQAGQSSDLSALDKGFRKLANRVKPLVVGIEVFERVTPEAKPGTTTVAFEKKKLLTFSGVVWNKDGTIVSVLRGEFPRGENSDSEIGFDVVLSNQRSYSAKLLARDEYTGICVFRLHEPPKSLKAVKVNPKRWDADLEVGTMVMALGDTIRTGLVTNTRQRIAIKSDAFSFPRAIRTNIAADTGTFGGLLCDTRGFMLGMLAFELEKAHGSILRRGGGVHASRESGSSVRSGDVLAIPVDLLARVVKELVKTGTFARGAIGIEFKPVGFDQLCLGDSSRSAAWVSWVHPDGSAAKMGLREGDVVIGVSSEIFRTSEDLSWFTELVEYGTIGDMLTFKYFHFDPKQPSLNNIKNGTVVIGRRDGLARIDRTPEDVVDADKH